MDSNTMYLVTNRSASTVVYSIPEDGIRRAFAPGETKKIRHGELEKLSYRDGGKVIISEYLLIRSEEAIADLEKAINTIITKVKYYTRQSVCIRGFCGIYH